jgi:hypothetical protein
MAYLKSGNETYELKLGCNGLSEFEAITGKSLMGNQEMEFSFQEIRIILHLAIKGGNHKYRNNLEETGDLLDVIAKDRGMEYLAEMIEKTTHIQNAHTHTQEAHTHVQPAHTHVQPAHTHTQPAHSHMTGISASSAHGTTPGTSSANVSFAQNASNTSNTTATNNNTTATNNNTTATNNNTTATNNNTTATNQNTGGGEAHNNMQPWQTFYIWERVA